MVVNLAHKIGGDRGRVASANERRGLTAAEYNAQARGNPLHISVPLFERWLVKKFGADYLEPIDYMRLESGALVPSTQPLARIKAAFRLHGADGLTRQEARQITKLSYSQVASLIRAPLFEPVELVHVPHQYAMKWRLA